MNKVVSIFTKASLIQKIILIVISLYLVIWIISSPLIKHFVKPMIEEQGLIMTDSASFRFNPFLTQITVSDLKLLKAQQTVLATEKLVVQVTLLQLLFDNITISQFSLQNAFLAIERTSEQLIIAGIDLNQLNNQTSKIEEDSNPENQETTPFPYQILLPELSLENVQFDLKNDNSHHTFTIKELRITDLIASEQSQQVSINIDSTLDKAHVELTADIQLEQGAGQANSMLAITGYPLNALQEYIENVSQLKGLFSFKSEQLLSFNSEEIKAHIKQAQLSNEALFIEANQHFLTLESFQNNISDLTLTLNNNQITELAGTSQLAMTNASVFYQQAEQKLAHFEQLIAEDIHLELAQTPVIKIDNFQIDNITASKNENINLPALAQLKQFAMTNILLSEGMLGIDKVTLDSLTADIILNEEKALANLVLLPKAESEQNQDTPPLESTEPTAQNEQEPVITEEQLIISLGGFSLINENQISFIDNSVEPAYKRDLYIDELTLGALANTALQQEQKTPFKLVGRSNKYAHFDMHGFIQPFAKIPTHSLTGYLKELSLPDVSTYMKEATQLALKSGQLNTDIKVTLVGEKLDGSIQLLLQGIETEVAESDEVDNLVDKGALPLNLALGMLKDNDGNVEIEVPISGSTSDPQFGLHSILGLLTQKAIWMATQDYLMKTFIPYANIVSMTMTVGELAFKLRFDDLLYQAKQITPDAAQHPYLKEFISLMHKKEKTRVNICAISTPEDIGLPSGEEITDKAIQNKLKEIGTQREQALKDYLVTQGKISSSRILLCAPKIDTSKEAKPRIAISV